MKATIGSLNEGALHRTLKELKTEKGDEIECHVDGYIVDIKKADRIVEIQTSNLHRVVPKFCNLMRNHPLQLVYPIAARTTIIKSMEDGSVQKRKSPKRGTIYDIFSALVSAPTIISNPNFSLEVPLIHEAQVRVFDSNKAWRKRHWVIVERRLIESLNTYWFVDPSDLWLLFAKQLPPQFSTKIVAENVRITRRLAQQALYCLRLCGAVNIIGKNGNERIYQASSTE